MLDTIKTLGFHYATQAGITVSKNDIVIPPDKDEILARLRGAGRRGRGPVRARPDHRGRAARVRSSNIWTEATDTVADAMEKTLYELNPIYMMANSGARGSFKQIRQLAGMRGLMANPKGEIIERPIKANFMEGLSVLEYFISTHGARKGLADTALRTADSGYLTRRLVDVAQDVIIREEDCGTKEFIERAAVPPAKASTARRPAASLAQDVYKPLKDGKPGKTKLATKGEELTPRTAARGRRGARRGRQPRRRSPCARCSSARASSASAARATARSSPPASMAEIGDAVGIIAAQSIGEPGTQLTMRTFHTGGVAGARHHARSAARRRDLRGAEPEGRRAARGDRRHRRDRADRARPEGRHPSRTRTGKADEAPEPIEYQLPRRTRLLVEKGERVEPGDPLDEGSLDADRAARAARTRGQGARRRPSCTSSARCRRSTSRRASTSTTSTSS